MAYIRQKGKYFYVAQSYREGDQVKQRVLGYLGKHESLDAAIRFIRNRIKAHSRVVPQARNSQILAMHESTLLRYKRDLEKKLGLRKRVGSLLSPEQEKEILKQERAATKRLAATHRALRKLSPKVGGQ